MKFTKIAMWSSAAFVAAAAFSAFDGGAAVANSAARPIRGTAHGGLTGFTEAGQLVLDYTGTASHLGIYTRREVLAIDGGNVSGTIAIIAANGDELDASFTGHFVSAEDVVGTYTFTGGTGRFSDATGSADFTAHAPSVFDVSVSFDGTIGY